MFFQCGDSCICPEDPSVLSVMESDPRRGASKPIGNRGMHSFTRKGAHTQSRTLKFSNNTPESKQFHISIKAQVRQNPDPGQHCRRRRTEERHGQPLTCSTGEVWNFALSYLSDPSVDMSSNTSQDNVVRAVRKNVFGTVNAVRLHINVRHGSEEGGEPETAPIATPGSSTQWTKEVSRGE